MLVTYIPDIQKYLISLIYYSFISVCTFYRFLNFQIQISQNSKKVIYALLPLNPRNSLLIVSTDFLINAVCSVSVAESAKTVYSYMICCQFIREPTITTHLRFVKLPLGFPPSCVSLRR